MIKVKITKKQLRHLIKESLGIFNPKAIVASLDSVLSQNGNSWSVTLGPLKYGHNSIVITQRDSVYRVAIKKNPEGEYSAILIDAPLDRKKSDYDFDSYGGRDSDYSTIRSVDNLEDAFEQIGIPLETVGSPIWKRSKMHGTQTHLDQID
jgi:hypothetical protein|tara:strand:- start:87 stop:536 length:450 start_codon:yes stop_codon:yes gene_type:complete